MLSLLPIPALTDNYIWLAHDASASALAIDPGDAAPVRTALAKHRLRLSAIFLTHHHADHIDAAAELREEFDVPVYAPDDARIAMATIHVVDGMRLVLGAPASSWDVLAVPGHTLSHVAYHGNDVLFAGDTLFSVGCGRLFEGTPTQMLASLDRLAALPHETRLCCGHEYTLANCAFATTIEPYNAALIERAIQARAAHAAGLPTVPISLHSELATNPFLRVDVSTVIDWARRRHGITPGDRLARFAALRSDKDQFRAPPP